VRSEAVWWKVKARRGVKQAKALGKSAGFGCTRGRDVLIPDWPDPPGCRQAAARREG